ncbi:hypothetical protein [Aureivirga sp. CE67]|uniref:hypothetical protein n=1 Tax=Aureivirga sp. CE67 TaxID=1788983 RepID=UPI0018CB18F4|nr:hypothetical protein [Aureivirga sp. CE67]
MKTIKFFIGIFLITIAMNAQNRKFDVLTLSSPGSAPTWDIGHRGYLTLGNKRADSWGPYRLQIYNYDYNSNMGLLIGNRLTQGKFGVQGSDNQFIGGAKRGDLCIVSSMSTTSYSNKGNIFLSLNGSNSYTGNGNRFISLGSRLRTKTLRVFDNEKVVVGNNFSFDSEDYLLYVGKGIKTEKIKVNIASENGWADYVFADDYQLRSLGEVEEYIEENNHLPEVPSTEEVMENGVELKEMTVLLLKKVEELTLYTIEQEKKIKELSEKLENKK